MRCFTLILPAFALACGGSTTGEQGQVQSGGGTGGDPKEAPPVGHTVGGTSSGSSGAGGSGNAGSGAVGATTGSAGTHSVGGATSSGGNPSMGGAPATGGTPASGGSPMSGGSPGSGGTAGSAPTTACVGIDYCACRDRSDCQVQSTACFCPCGEYSCEPSCDCVCGGGVYQGCTPTTIFSPGALEGIWLIGWSGGMNHYSWVRLTGEMAGVADFLDGADLAVNGPFWSCSGQGSWLVTAKPNTVMLTFPSECNLPAKVLTFETFQLPTGWPNGVRLVAQLTDLDVSVYLEGYQFPPSQCDAAMASCTDPL